MFSTIQQVPRPPDAPAEPTHFTKHRLERQGIRSTSVQNLNPIFICVNDKEPVHTRALVTHRGAAPWLGVNPGAARAQVVCGGLRLHRLLLRALSSRPSSAALVPERQPKLLPGQLIAGLQVEGRAETKRARAAGDVWTGGFFSVLLRLVPTFRLTAVVGLGRRGRTPVDCGGDWTPA